MPQSGLIKHGRLAIYLYSPSRILQGLRFSSGLRLQYLLAATVWLKRPESRPRARKQSPMGSSGAVVRIGLVVEGHGEETSPASDPQKALADSVLPR